MVDQVMAPMAELCMTEARGEEETGQAEELMVAAEVAANPAADIADIGDMPGGR